TNAPSIRIPLRRSERACESSHRSRGESIMSNGNRSIDNGFIKLTFLRTADDTDGALLEMAARYRPHSPEPPAHYHPKQEETFEIVSGALRFVVGGVEHVVHAGERIVIPAGAVHSACNPTDEEA